MQLNKFILQYRSRIIARKDYFRISSSDGTPLW